MANHPYNSHREQQVAHRRVDTILSGSPSGAKKHMANHAYSQITSKSAAVRDDDIGGSRASNRFARGGKVGKHGGKGNHTAVNIVIPGGGAKPPMPMGPPGGPPPGGPPMMAPHPPMGGPPGMPPGGPPPGMPPGGPPPGMPMRAAGGRIRNAGMEKAMVEKSASRAKKNSYASGGGLPTAGMATGVGRKQLAAMQKRK